jgi:FAD/FMN-containing dehydrogenase
LGAHTNPVASVPDATVERFRTTFGGHLVGPDDDDYEEARRIWNGAIDRKPGLIARCRRTEDVVAAVRFAREQEFLVSVRGGGHGVGGHSLCDGGLVIDLSPMRDVDVDPAAATVRAGAGVLLGELDGATQPFGLAVPAGIVTHTGVAGLTLGGGIGWLMRKHGLTADNLIEAEVVLADGTVVVANAEDTPELLWALRGGGGNYGIVTSFLFRAHRVGPIVHAGALMFPLERSDEVLDAYRAWAAATPRELTSILNFRQAPPAPWVPDPQRGTPALIVAACYVGDASGADRAIEPLRALGPTVDAFGPRPFLELQSLFDASVPAGWHYYWKSVELDQLAPSVVEHIVGHTERLTSPRSYTIVFQLGGAITDVPEMGSAFPRRQAGFNININAVWLPDQEASSSEHLAWARSLFDAVEPYACGVYVNFLGDEGDHRIVDAYGREKYEALRGIKARYDPTNFFVGNQNIPPA